MELTVAYSPKINCIIERTNDLVTSKDRCLLLDTPSKISQLLWPEAFNTAIYLLNPSLLSFLKYNCPLAVWLRAYNSTNESYISNLSHFQTFDCRVYTKIPDEKWFKSQKTTSVGGRKGYFIGYNSENIYRIYFPNSWQIEIVQDLEFNESLKYEETRTTTEGEPLFSFFKLELFFDDTFNTLVKDEELSTASPTPSTLHFVEGDADLFCGHFSNNDFPPSPQISSKIWHKLICYDLVAQHIALSSVA